MTTIHRSLVATAVGVLLLAACGSTSTSSNVDRTTSRPSTTVVETTAALDLTTGAVDTTAAPATTASPTPAAPVTVDASVDQALKDADALLGANDQDIASASSAAANGG